jgi:hypothetical protein
MTEMPTAERRTAGPRALSYVKSELSTGGPLSRLLLDRVSSAEGLVSVLVPVGLQITDDTNFGDALSPSKTKSIGWVKKPTLKEALAALIRDFLIEHNERVCLFEDQAATRGFPYVERLDTRIMYSNSHVYHALVCEDDLARIEETIRSIRSWLTVAALSTSANTANRARGARGGEPALNEVAKNASSVIVGAFDGEGYLIWTP